MSGLSIFDLQETGINCTLSGKIILLWGTNRTGKSAVASQLFPGKTLWIATELGYNAIGGMKKVDVDSWSAFREIVKQLTGSKTKDKARQMYDCVVIDVADRLPNLCNQYICEEMDVDNIADVAYGGGYSALNKEFDSQINKLSLSGFCVVLICHDEAKTFNAKTADEYEMLIPKNTFSKAGACLKDIPDFIIYLEPQGVDEDGNVKLSIGHTALHAKKFFAGGRFPEIQPVISPFTAEGLKEAIINACKARAKALGVSEVSFDEVKESYKADTSASRKYDLGELQANIVSIAKLMSKKGLKDKVAGIVTRFLGEGAKIADTTEADITALVHIYDKIVSLADEKGIDIDEEEDV